MRALTRSLSLQFGSAVKLPGSGGAVVGLCLDAARLVRGPGSAGSGGSGGPRRSDVLFLSGPLGGDEAGLPGGGLRLLRPDAI